MKYKKNVNMSVKKLDRTECCIWFQKYCNKNVKTLKMYHMPKPQIVQIIHWERDKEKKGKQQLSNE